MHRTIQKLFVLLSLAFVPGCVSARERMVSTDAEELITRGDLAFQRGARPEALELFQLAAAGAKTSGKEALFREAAAMVAALHALEDKPHEAQPWLSQAGAGASSEEPEVWTRLLMAQGLVARAKDQPYQALRRFEELFAFAEERRLFDRALQATSLAALVAEGDERIDWARRGVEAAKGAGQPRWEAAAWGTLAWTLEEEGDSVAALEAFRSSRRLYGDHGQVHERLKSDWALAHGLRMAGEVAMSRALQERVLQAAKAFQQHGWSPNDSEWVARSYEEMAELDLLRGHYSGAMKHVAAARKNYVLADAETLAPNLLERVDELSARISGAQAGSVGGE